jgi:hypothetical protein
MACPDHFEKKFMFTNSNSRPIPFLGARKLARQLSAEVDELRARLNAEEEKTQKLSGYTIPVWNRGQFLFHLVKDVLD